MLSEALSQVLKVDVTKVAGRPPARLQVVRAEAAMGAQLSETNTAGLSDPYAGSANMSVFLG
jgi:hypothetical protein